MKRFTSISNTGLARCYSSGTNQLKQRLAELIPEKQAEVKDIRAKYGSEILGTCTVDQAYGGMRAVKSMVTETSLLDAEEGIRFRGLSIPECQQQLPTGEGKEPLPEALLWLLITGEVPTVEQAADVTRELSERAVLSDATLKTIDVMSGAKIHPMSQLVAAIAAEQKSSIFAQKYREGSIGKKDYWDPTFEDSLNLIAKLPEIAGYIYRANFPKDNGDMPSYNKSLDWSENYARFLGKKDDKVFDDLMRLYMVIHSDHEGGNVSAHATHLVGSVLSDPYLSFAGGMCGLAGPLHGLANQEVLRWTTDFASKVGENPSNEQIEKACWDTLNSGKVIPGFGHAVLRKTDPRYMAQREFALKHLPEDPLVKLTAQLYEVVPKVLTEHGKTANPFPNVDAHSGVLLKYYGVTEFDYYTVMFGVSRALGVLPSLVWDRALGYPLERPKSVTSGWIADHFAAKKN